MTATLFRGARIVGREDARRDVLVAGGRIASVSAPGKRMSTSDIAAAGATSADVRDIDLDGRFLGPGLWDHHVHFSQWALVRQRIDLQQATSAAHAAALVRKHVLGVGPLPADAPVVGYGFRAATWPDAPSLELLDGVAPGHPIVLMSADLHGIWLDRTALALFGHPLDGECLLREDDAFAVARALQSVSDAELDAMVHDAAAAAAARGVVGVVELEMTDNLTTWTRRAARTRSLRVQCGVYPAHLEAAIARGLKTGDVVPGTSGLVTVGPFKLITDGSLNTRTAWCHDPYPPVAGDPHPFGFPTVAYDEVVRLIRRAAAHGLVPTVHAIGDRANKIVLDAFEETSCSGSIEHAQLVSSEDLPRFAQLGITASVQPEHAMDDRDVADVLWAGRTARAFPLEALVASGAALVLGSDAPVAPLDPWVSMAAAISRSRDGRAPWHPEQRIAHRAAYRASVADPLLAVGSTADLVATEIDPLRATDGELRAMPVSATMLAGEFTHLRV